jgi:hypothetical protein
MILHSGFFGYVGKRTVSIVAIQNAAAVAENEEIRKAIIIKVTDGHSHSEKSFCAHTRTVRYVSECSIPIIVV